MQELLSDVNWTLIMPLLIIWAIITLIALIDWIRIEETNGPKWLWLPIILFVSTLGPILYFVIGRRQH